MHRVASRSFRRTSTIVAAVAVAGMMSACGSPDPEISITLSDFAFAPAQISIPRAQRVLLKFQNTGSVEHRPRVEQINASTGIIPPGQNATLEISAPGGSLKMVCGIPGHEEQGMIGQIIVGQRTAPR